MDEWSLKLLTMGFRVDPGMYKGGKVDPESCAVMLAHEMGAKRVRGVGFPCEH